MLLYILIKFLDRETSTFLIYIECLRMIVPGSTSHRNFSLLTWLLWTSQTSQFFSNDYHYFLSKFLCKVSSTNEACSSRKTLLQQFLFKMKNGILVTSAFLQIPGKHHQVFIPPVWLRYRSSWKNGNTNRVRLSLMTILSLRFFKLAKKWNSCFLRFFKLAKNEIHVFWGFLSLQKMKYYLRFFKLPKNEILFESCFLRFLSLQKMKFMFFEFF